jgi:hypothetical protein
MIPHASNVHYAESLTIASAQKNGEGCLYVSLNEVANKGSVMD